MENSLQKSEGMKEKICYLAFPGMGKTTYAQENFGFVDLDFNFIKSAFNTKYHKNDLQFQYTYFTKLAAQFANQGWTVLSNEPALIPFLKQAKFIIVVEVPSNIDKIIQRIRHRDGDTEFTRRLEIHAHEWIENWKRIAKENEVPCVMIDSFSELSHLSSDDYFKVIYED